jgi:hypothetical protein
VTEGGRPINKGHRANSPRSISVQRLPALGRAMLEVLKAKLPPCYLL